MNAVHVAVGVGAITLSGLAGALGLWLYWRVRVSTWFWRLLRAGQAAVLLDLALGGLDALLGRSVSGLHVLYGVLPLLVAVIAESLRAASADMVLAARGMGSAAEVGRLPAEEQEVVAITIVQREQGVMALACVVVVVLLARAAGTA